MANIINNEAQKAYDFIEKGGVILYPTDTVWGLGCDATNCNAVEKIYQLNIYLTLIFFLLHLKLKTS